MANVKITDMTPGSALTGAELFESVQSSATVSLLASQIKTYAATSPVTTTVRVVTAAGAVTVTTADYAVIVNKTVGAATTVNLPAGSTGLTFIIKDGKGDANANNITITPAAGNIDGSATYVMTSVYQSVSLMYNGTQWNLV